LKTWPRWRTCGWLTAKKPCLAAERRSPELP
jgi:hypothetical protein